MVSISLNPSCPIFLLKKRLSSAAHRPQICIVKIRKLRTYPWTLHFIFFHGILFSVIRRLESREWRHFIMTCRALMTTLVKCKTKMSFSTFYSSQTDQANFENYIWWHWFFFFFASKHMRNTQIYFIKIFLYNKLSS